MLKLMNSYRALPRRHLANSPFNVAQPLAPEPEQYSLQDRVTHDKNGLGTVIGLEEGFGVLVDFGSHQKHLRTPCSMLFKL
jgi:hypothetical protein